jgi:hypothetical protein
METERQISGAVLRADSAWLEKNGLMAQVRERLAPETQALLDKPPMAVTWVTAHHLDALHEALLAVGGEHMLVQLGQEAAKTHGVLLERLLKTVSSLFGASPAALFSHMDSFMETYIKGTSFNWEPTGERAGVLRISNVEPAPLTWYLRLKGPVLSVFNAVSAKGTIDACDIDPDGKSAAYRVSWS